MLSHSRLKFLRSLHLSKIRTREFKFLADGIKLVNECLDGQYNKQFNLLEIFAVEPWITQNQSALTSSSCPITPITSKQLEQISHQKTPNQAVALLEYSPDLLDNKLNCDELYLCTDQVQDPGNMGTLFRLAEWFGISKIFLSTDSADPLNPKVIQSSMGSILRVPFTKVDLPIFLQDLPKEHIIYGTQLDGVPINTASLSKGGMIIMGNESQGLSQEVAKLVNQSLLIPRFPIEKEFPESLNVGVAAGIILSAFRL